jgi:hypothetical protein
MCPNLGGTKMLVSIRKSANLPAYLFLSLNRDEYFALYGVPFDRGSYSRRKIIIKGNMNGEGLIIEANDEGRSSFRKTNSRSTYAVEASVNAVKVKARGDVSISGINIKPLIYPRKIVIPTQLPIFQPFREVPSMKTAGHEIGDIARASAQQGLQAVLGAQPIGNGAVPLPTRLTAVVEPSKPVQAPPVQVPTIKALRQAFQKFNFMMYLAKVRYGKDFSALIDPDTGMASFTLRVGGTLKIGKPGEQPKVLTRISDITTRNLEPSTAVLSDEED